MFHIRIAISSVITLVALTVLFLSGCQALSATGQALGNGMGQFARDSEVSTRIPLNSDDLEIDTLGDLGYLGGLKLSSKDKRFGGLSGLLISDDGTRFLSVSDKGNWVTGQLLYNGESSLVRDTLKSRRCSGPMAGLLKARNSAMRNP